MTCKFKANWTFVDDSGQSWPSWRTCPANSGSRALRRGKGNGSSGWLRSAFEFPAGRFRTKASEASDWLTRPWNPARSNARPASRTAKTQFWRDGGDYWGPCADLGLFWCVSFREPLAQRSPSFSSHSVNNGREALRESLGRATAEYPLSAVLVLLL